ncbi:MAG: hypothetical protein HYZ95_00820 [Candidatus Omnitrophica bacterium]|nr:hypothetical protein [Candidatus Omnitrophota bacterium]
MQWVILLAGFLVAELCGDLPAFAGTCALCREALSSGAGEGLIRGFYFSILLIAGMPLLIFAAAAVLVWRARRGKQPVVERNEPS